MSLTNKSLKSKLAKYSKEDIIEAICSEFQSDYFVTSILRTLAIRTRMDARTLTLKKNALHAETNASAMNAFSVIKPIGNGTVRRIRRKKHADHHPSRR